MLLLLKQCHKKSLYNKYNNNNSIHIILDYKISYYISNITNNSNNITDKTIYNNDNNVNNILSKRQKFRDIVPDVRTLDYLDRLGLGYLTKRQQRITLAKKFSDENRPKPNRHDKKSNYKNISPYPFDKVGKLLMKISKFKDISSLSSSWLYSNSKNNDIKIIYDPPEVAIIGRSNVGKSTLLNRYFIILFLILIIITNDHHI